ncbi:glycosyltransferase [Bacillus sp. Marseille-P3661]|uniref:glycosyltransferase n=1 Tax=Bacillus sp. Marseille-P3661 TaxID=1936234 RepID=UPI000C85095F|nr:glycosyltransferase [Bacillus sp. Marseille-P3661]
MKIKILTVGTRGDVQPFVALGKGLVKRGYKVTICTGENFKAFVESNGLNFAAVRVDILKLTHSEEGKKMMSGNPFHILKNLKTIIFPMMERMLEDFWLVAKDADVLIYHPKAFGGYDIAEKLEIPVFVAHPVPVIARTALFTNPVMPFSFKIDWINKMSFKVNRLLMVSFFKMINRWRKETLGLASKRSVLTDDLCLKGKPIPILYGCSPQVIPYDESWNENVSMSGFWFLEEENWEPPIELLQFIEQGPPPIAVTFSSMPLKNPRQIIEMLEESLRLTGQRGVLITGWSGLNIENAKPHIFTINTIPHSWLFPKTVGVIHHGGAGTTASVLKAGKPMLICPFSADQPFWANRMQELGLAPTPLKEKDMSVETFTRKIEELLVNDTLTKNCTDISTKINSEDGIEDTIKFIEKNIS